MKKTGILLLFSLCLTLIQATAFAGSAPTMSKEELKPLLGSENLVILDARSGRDWSSSEFKIVGAVRAPGSDYEQWGNQYPKNARIVLYCA